MALHRLRLALVLVLGLGACVEAPAGSGGVAGGAPGNAPASASGGAATRVLVMGDSMFAANGLAGQNVAAGLRAEYGGAVKDHALPGARFFYYLPISGAVGMRIPAQARPDDNGKPWDWYVVNGGGNDILFGCGCTRCDKGYLDRLITRDGARGAIPKLVSSLRASGARVAWAGYLRTPGIRSPIEDCNAIGDEFDRRLGAMAARDPGVIFVPMADLVPEGDLSFHGLDRVHPSAKGSRAIARRLAQAMREAPRLAPKPPTAQAGTP